MYTIFTFSSIHYKLYTFNLIKAKANANATV